MTTMLLGETAEFWCRIRAAMKKAHIETPAELERRLGVTPPNISIVFSPEIAMWKIVENQFLTSVLGDRNIAFTSSKEEAERIVLALQVAR